MNWYIRSAPWFDRVWRCGDILVDSVFFTKLVCLGFGSCLFVHIGVRYGELWTHQNRANKADHALTLGSSTAFMKSLLTSSISTSFPVVGSVTAFLVPFIPIDL